MEPNPIQQTWDDLAGRRREFVERFYARFFERHPGYRAKFPESMDAQMEHMVEMVSSVARFSDRMDLIQPYLHNVGFAHRRVGIGEQDVENFKACFIEALAESGLAHWDEAHERAWHQVFDDVVVPMFDEGLETGRNPPAAGTST